MLKLPSIGGIKNDERRDAANDGAAQLSLLPAPSEALSLPVMPGLAWPAHLGPVREQLLVHCFLLFALFSCQYSDSAKTSSVCVCVSQVATHCDIRSPSPGEKRCQILRNSVAAKWRLSIFNPQAAAGRQE